MPKKKELEYLPTPRTAGEKVARWNLCQFIMKMIYLSTLSTDHLKSVALDLENGATQILIKTRKK